MLHGYNTSLKYTAITHFSSTRTRARTHAHGYSCARDEGFVTQARAPSQCADPYSPHAQRTGTCMHTRNYASMHTSARTVHTPPTGATPTRPMRRHPNAFTQTCLQQPTKNHARHLRIATHETLKPKHVLEITTCVWKYESFGVSTCSSATQPSILYLNDFFHG
eukprot:6184418-Pleurochrysis_carterae.AAC.3